MLLLLLLLAFACFVTAVTYCGVLPQRRAACSDFSEYSNLYSSVSFTFHNGNRVSEAMLMQVESKWDFKHRWKKIDMMDSF